MSSVGFPCPSSQRCLLGVRLPKQGTLGWRIRCEDVFRSQVGGTMWGWHAVKCARGRKAAATVEKEWDLRELLIKSFLYFRALPELVIRLSPKGIYLYLQHEEIASTTVSSWRAVAAEQGHASPWPDCAVIWAMGWQPRRLSSLGEPFSAVRTEPQTEIGVDTTSDSLFSTADWTECTGYFKDWDVLWASRSLCKFGIYLKSCT